MSKAAQPALGVVVADDEALAADELVYLLQQFPDLELLGTARNGLEAVQLIETHEPDLVFLDVNMPGLDGLGVIRTLRERNVPLPFFVLATAHDNYAVEAFSLEAFDYLLKPVERDRLAQTLERAQRFAAERAAKERPEVANVGMGAALQRNKLLLKRDNRNFLVDAQDVVYATIEDGLISVVTTSMEGQSNYRTIEELQSNLDPNLFWRVHRSFLVNVNRIREVIPWFKSSFQLKMDDRKGTEIPVSRVQTKRLRALLKL
jgi:two-component system LytT family response regulator/two-component system response regulator LytT